MRSLLLLFLLFAIPFDGYAAAIRLPQTGQKTCYDQTGNLITCVGTRQDGDLQIGLPAPVPRFHDNANGTVTDNLTGLIWLKDANCFPSQNWQDALATVSTLQSGQCGLIDSSVAGDWRLPNIHELESLVDLSNINPPLPAGAPFTGVQVDFYWSSSTHSHLTDKGRCVSMSNGAIDGFVKTDLHPILAVRGGQ